MNATVFEGYQLLGASNMVRFCNEIMHSKPTKNEQGCAQVGLCVSEQGIRQLTRRISRAQTEVSTNVVVCIGTNDVKKLVRVRGFKIGLRSLVKVLGARNAVWLPIPPLLYYRNCSVHVERLQQFNWAINHLAESNSNITVLDLHGQCVNHDGRIIEDIYTKFYTPPANIPKLNIPVN